MSDRQDGQVRLGLGRVRGRSMLPTLRDGDVLLLGYGLRPRAGRLAIVELPPDDAGYPRPVSVKRLAERDPAGGPGWWVTRDNPREGVDSWTVGALAPEAIQAVVLCRLPRMSWLIRR